MHHGPPVELKNILSPFHVFLNEIGSVCSWLWAHCGFVNMKTGGISYCARENIYEIINFILSDMLSKYKQRLVSSLTWRNTWGINIPLSAQSQHVTSKGCLPHGTAATDPLVIPASILGHNTPSRGIPTWPLEQQNSLNSNGYFTQIHLDHCHILNREHGLGVFSTENFGKFLT